MAGKLNEIASDDAAQPLEERVSALIDLMRPAIKADGGDLEFLGVTEAGVVLVRLHGECVGCPSAGLTLQHGVERRLRENIPEVAGVEQVK